MVHSIVSLSSLSPIKLMRRCGIRKSRIEKNPNQDKENELINTEVEKDTIFALDKLIYHLKTSNPAQNKQTASSTWEGFKSTRL